jgi:hypothetical protein
MRNLTLDEKITLKGAFVKKRGFFISSSLQKCNKASWYADLYRRLYGKSVVYLFKGRAKIDPKEAVWKKELFTRRKTHV